MHPKKVKGLSQNNNDKVLNDSMGTNVPTHNYANSTLMLTLYTKPLLNAMYHVVTNYLEQLYKALYSD